MDTLGPANLGIILLLYRGCPLSAVNLYCCGPQNLSFIERSNVLCPFVGGSVERGYTVQVLNDLNIVV